jgi:hypothetical protein
VQRENWLYDIKVCYLRLQYFLSICVPQACTVSLIKPDEDQGRCKFSTGTQLNIHMFFMTLVISHHLLNIFVQLANKRGLKKIYVLMLFSKGRSLWIL